MPRLPPVEYSPQLARACRINNLKVCEAASDKEGGNTEALAEILGREVNCEEFTFKDWTSESGADFVAVVLLVNYGSQGS